MYVSLFPNSELLSVNRLAPGPGEGAALVEFELEGMRFTALDGGLMFRLTPVVSFVVACESQEEIDHYWYGPSEGGEQMPCGWLTDWFGLSWQVAPAELGELMGRAAGPVMEALLGMARGSGGRWWSEGWVSRVVYPAITFSGRPRRSRPSIPCRNISSAIKAFIPGNCKTPSSFA